MTIDDLHVFLPGIVGQKPFVVMPEPLAPPAHFGQRIFGRRGLLTPSRCSASAFRTAESRGNVRHARVGKRPLAGFRRRI